MFYCGKESNSKPVKSINRHPSDYPKISVEMGCYNFGKYINEAIESVLAQTLLPYEFIISDDHSTDRSWEIIQSYARMYPDLIYAFQPSENIGMKKCGIMRKDLIQGELFSTIDGDDRWLPRKLELEWEALKNNPEAKIAYSNVYIIDEKGKRTQVWYDGKGEPPPSGDVFIQTFSKRFFKNTRGVFRNHLMYYSVLKEIGYRNFEEKILHPDWDKKIRMTAKYPVAYSGHALVEYRQHKHGIHVIHAEKNIGSIIAVYEKNKHLLDKRPLWEAVEVKRSIDDLVKLLKKSDFKKTPSRSIIHASSDNTSGRFRLMVNSLPKSGTHLLKKVVTLLGFRGTDIHISKNLVRGNENSLAQDCLLPAGVDWPEPVSSDVVRNFLRKVPEGCFASAHMPFSRSLSSILRELGIKTLLILRDPRDVVVSMANYVPRDPAHFLFSFYKDLSEKERIMVSITGIKPDENGGPGLFSIGERWRKVLPWLDQPYNHTAYFETLVGPQGGGSLGQQKNEIKQIALHLCLNGKTPDEDWVAEHVFGGTTTFRKGQIGGWRKNFSELHKQIFKEIAGDILIEWGYEKDYDW